MARTPITDLSMTPSDLQPPKPEKVNISEQRVEREVARREQTIEEHITKKLPGILSRAADTNIAADKLLPIERAVREWQQDMIRHLGGPKHITTPQRTLLTAACGTWAALSTIDALMLDLAVQNGLVDLEKKTVYPLVAQRQRVAESLARQLKDLGLARVTPVLTIEEAIADAKRHNARYQNGAR